MLTKRTNILFDPLDWKTLLVVAKTKKTSVANLIRQAVEQIYLEKGVPQIRQKAWQTITQIRPHFKGKLDYEELINYGREH